MKKLFHHKTFVYAALLLWLFASASGMHGHYCFDGLEPPVSVHFDLMSDHHIDDEHVTHKDFDSKPQVSMFKQVSVFKLTNLDLPFLAALFFLVIIWPVIRSQFYILSKTPSSWLTVTGLRPPLRAPPAINA